MRYATNLLVVSEAPPQRTRRRALVRTFTAAALRFITGSTLTRKILQGAVFTPPDPSSKALRYIT